MRGDSVLRHLLPGWNYGRELATDQDFSSLLKAYRNWVYVCASKNATTVASIPIALFTAKESTKAFRESKTRPITKKREEFLRRNPGLAQLPQVRKAVEIEEVLEHPFLDLMRNVNRFMNAFSLWELTELHQELVGNAYWYIVEGGVMGQSIPVEIWPMMPSHVKVIPDREKFISGYLYQHGMVKKRLEEHEIIHFKFPSPASLYYGASPLSAITGMYNIGENMNTYENALFSNMGRLEGAFETDADLSDAEFERLKEEIKQGFQGAKNVGKSPLLERGVHYKQYGYAPREMAFLQGRKAVKEMICNAYGQSVGMYDKDATRANSETASYLFMRDTIRPRCLRIEQKLNEKLMPRYDGSLFVAFEDCVPEDREFALRERESNLKTGYSSINMERQGSNEETVEWGEVPILPFSMAPLGSATPPPPSSQGEGRPPTGEELVEFEDMVVAAVEKRMAERKP